ncbi:hypothetical protein NOK12_16700 [Nocardioides sp. OK12]|uniref:hypothetical protein n=1 Tax=Nocardioides sp. OK12 TaxID=2758661 RepID=UPI0021C40A03|nr:hypothetical protein [Nocardioides sp. OK12]GHJ59152.1 hypothetical protein NOK12_16700 [Nocardioides sp. OK12]
MEPIGDLLDSLGICHHPEPGELIAGAVVLLKVIDEDGDVSVRQVTSDGLNWLERMAMLRVAELTERPEFEADE